MRWIKWLCFTTMTLMASACSDDSEDTSPTPSVIDGNVDYPDTSANAIILRTPELLIPAYSERQFCLIDTYRGEDVGIVTQRSYQGLMGHHLSLFGTTLTEADYPDGSLIDCTSSEVMNMAAMEPIIIGGEIIKGETYIINEFQLPEGMAALLNEGQRIVLQAHYLNTGAQAVRVTDEIQLEIVPEDSVTTWAAPYVNTVTNFEIPANTSDFNITFDCTIGSDSPELTFLYVGGHLHEWGKSFATYHTRDGVKEKIYEVPVWDPAFRDAPKYLGFEPGEFVARPGDVFTTSCTWFNDTDRSMEFPQEMCVTFGMVYPAKLPIVCDPS